MAFSKIFKNAASLTVTLFTKEQGMCTYQSKTPQTIYDEETGKVTKSFFEAELLIAFVALDDKEVPDLPNRSAHRKALIPGQYMQEPPKKGDYIITQDGTKLIISRIKTDMYNALYTAYVKAINTK